MRGESGHAPFVHFQIFNCKQHFNIVDNKSTVGLRFYKVVFWKRIKRKSNIPNGCTCVGLVNFLSKQDRYNFHCLREMLSLRICQWYPDKPARHPGFHPLFAISFYPHLSVSYITLYLSVSLCATGISTTREIME